MSEDNQDNNKQQQGSIRDQARAAVRKSGKERAVNKLKEIETKIAETEKTKAMLEAEADKVVADYEAGIF